MATFRKVVKTGGVTNSSTLSGLASSNLPNFDTVTNSHDIFNVTEPQKLDWMRSQLKQRVTEYTMERPLYVFCGSWNVNAKKPPENLSRWLLTPQISNPNDESSDPNGEQYSIMPDIYALGLQEVVDLKLGTGAAALGNSNQTKQALKHWEHGISQSLGRDNYTLIKTKHLVGLSLHVYVKNNLLPHVHDVRHEKIGVGFMGVGGNKGAVGIRFRIHDSSYVFINSHLAAHASKTDNRNQDFHSIIERMKFPTIHVPPHVFPFQIINAASPYSTKPTAAMYNQQQLHSQSLMTHGLQHHPGQIAQTLSLMDSEKKSKEREREKNDNKNANLEKNVTDNNPERDYDYYDDDDDYDQKEQQITTDEPYLVQQHVNYPTPPPTTSQPPNQPQNQPPNQPPLPSHHTQPYPNPFATMSITQHDNCFWVGDLNYRLNIPLSDIQTVYEIIDDAQKKQPLNLLDYNNYHLQSSAQTSQQQPIRYSKLLQVDQLLHAKTMGHAFVDWHEGIIDFAPTYKYQPGTTQWDPEHKRVPAWCDRIQWMGEDISQLTYQSVQLTISDHFPVKSIFRTVSRGLDIYKKILLVQVLLKHFLAMQILATPRLIFNQSLYNVGYLYYDIPVISQIILFNPSRHTLYWRMISPYEAKHIVDENDVKKLISSSHLSTSPQPVPNYYRSPNHRFNITPSSMIPKDLPIGNDSRNPYDGLNELVAKMNIFNQTLEGYYRESEFLPISELLIKLKNDPIWDLSDSDDENDDFDEDNEDFDNDNDDHDDDHDNDDDYNNNDGNEVGNEEGNAKRNEKFKKLLQQLEKKQQTYFTKIQNSPNKSHIYNNYQYQLRQQREHMELNKPAQLHSFTRKQQQQIQHTLYQSTQHSQLQQNLSYNKHNTNTPNAHSLAVSGAAFQAAQAQVAENPLYREFAQQQLYLQHQQFSYTSLNKPVSTTQSTILPPQPHLITYLPQRNDQYTHLHPQWMKFQQLQGKIEPGEVITLPFLVHIKRSEALRIVSGKAQLNSTLFFATSFTPLNVNHNINLFEPHEANSVLNFLDTDSSTLSSLNKANHLDIYHNNSNPNSAQKGGPASLILNSHLHSSSHRHINSPNSRLTGGILANTGSGTAAYQGHLSTQSGQVNYNPYIRAGNTPNLAPSYLSLTLKQRSHNVNVFSCSIQGTFQYTTYGLSLAFLCDTHTSVRSLQVQQSLLSQLKAVKKDSVYGQIKYRGDGSDGGDDGDDDWSDHSYDEYHGDTDSSDDDDGDGEGENGKNTKNTILGQKKVVPTQRELQNAPLNKSSQDNQNEILAARKLAISQAKRQFISRSTAPSNQIPPQPIPKEFFQVVNALVMSGLSNPRHFMMSDYQDFIKHAFPRKKQRGTNVSSPVSSSSSSSSSSMTASSASSHTSGTDSGSSCEELGKNGQNYSDQETQIGAFVQSQSCDALQFPTSASLDSINTQNPTTTTTATTATALMNMALLSSQSSDSINTMQSAGDHISNAIPQSDIAKMSNYLYQQKLQSIETNVTALGKLPLNTQDERMMIGRRLHLHTIAPKVDNIILHSALVTCLDEQHPIPVPHFQNTSVLWFTLLDLLYNLPEPLFPLGLMDKVISFRQEIQIKRDREARLRRLAQATPIQHTTTTNTTSLTTTTTTTTGTTVTTVTTTTMTTPHGAGMTIGPSGQLTTTLTDDLNPAGVAVPITNQIITVTNATNNNGVGTTVTTISPPDPHDSVGAGAVGVGGSTIVGNDDGHVKGGKNDANLGTQQVQQQASSPGMMPGSPSFDSISSLEHSSSSSVGQYKYHVQQGVGLTNFGPNPQNLGQNVQNVENINNNNNNKKKQNDPQHVIGNVVLTSSSNAPPEMNPFSFIKYLPPPLLKHQRALYQQQMLSLMSSFCFYILKWLPLSHYNLFIYLLSLVKKIIGLLSTLEGVAYVRGDRDEALSQVILAQSGVSLAKSGQNGQNNLNNQNNQKFVYTKVELDQLKQYIITKFTQACCQIKTAHATHNYYPFPLSIISYFLNSPDFL
jgi:hypothetical protein